MQSVYISARVWHHFILDDGFGLVTGGWRFGIHAEHYVLNVDSRIKVDGLK